MYPELQIGTGLTLNTYRTLGLAAMLLAGLTTYLSFRGAGVSRKQAALLLAAITAGFLAGARAFNVLTNPSAYTGQPGLLGGLYWGNFSLFGGILGGMLTGAVIGRQLQKDIWQLADATVYGIAGAVFLAKLGCYGNGCCFGIPTELPWGVTYPFGSLPSSYYLASALPTGSLFGIFASADAAVHPVQLYEGIGALFCAGASAGLSRRLSAAGSRFLVFLAGFSALRLGAWQLRVSPVTWGMGPAFYPLLYGTLIIGSLLILLWRNSSYIRRR